MRPTDDNEPIDTYVLGTTRSPGTVVFSGHDRMKNWDVQKAKGTAGASSNLNGDDIGTFKATHYLVDDGSDDPGKGQFDRWEAFEKLIKSTTDGGKPSALPIYHPDLARNGFTEVSNGGVSGMVHDGKGGATVVVTYIEFKPPKPKPAAKAKAKPPASYANTDEGKRSPPDPNAAAKAQLAALVAEAKKP
jgi:hypothetical protein